MFPCSGALSKPWIIFGQVSTPVDIILAGPPLIGFALYDFNIFFLLEINNIKHTHSAFYIDMNDVKPLICCYYLTATALSQCFNISSRFSTKSLLLILHSLYLEILVLFKRKRYIYQIWHHMAPSMSYRPITHSSYELQIKHLALWL